MAQNLPNGDSEYFDRLINLILLVNVLNCEFFAASYRCNSAL